MSSQPKVPRRPLKGRPHAAERKVTFGAPVFHSAKSSAPSGRPIGAPLGTLLVPRSCTHSLRFATGWFPQSLVKPSYARDPASEQVQFYCFPNSQLKSQSRLQVTFAAPAEQRKEEIKRSFAAIGFLERYILQAIFLGYCSEWLSLTHLHEIVISRVQEGLCQN